jgi:hypothetical protein
LRTRSPNDRTGWISIKWPMPHFRRFNRIIAETHFAIEARSSPQEKFPAATIRLTSFRIECIRRLNFRSLVIAP